MVDVSFNFYEFGFWLDSFLGIGTGEEKRQKENETNVYSGLI
jgi:hypothetical protein